MIRRHEGVARATARAGAAAVVLGAMAWSVIAPGAGRAAAPSFDIVTPGTRAVVTEPGIDVAPDGTVYLNGIQGIPSHSLLWRSTDGGAKFTKVNFSLPYSRFPGGGDADVALSPDGRVYFLDLWAGSNSISVSKDMGATWVQGTPYTTLSLSDRQWISLGKRGANGEDTVYAVYHFIQPPGSLALSRSDDGGATWTFHTLVPPPLGIPALPGQIVSDGDWVAFNYVNGRAMWIAISPDAGVSWKIVQVSADGENVFGNSLTAVAMDGNDLYIAWIDGDDFSVKVARSTDRGQTWGPAQRFATVAADGQALGNIFPWVAARSGKVAVAWYGANTLGDPNRDDSGKEWVVKYAESLDSGATWSDPVAATGVVKRGFVCTSGISCTAGRELGDFLQVAIGNDGRSLISFVDVAKGGYGKVARQGL